MRFSSLTRQVANRKVLGAWGAATAHPSHLAEIFLNNWFALRSCHWLVIAIGCANSTDAALPWCGPCRLRATGATSRRGGKPIQVRSSILTHPYPICHPQPRPCRRICHVCCELPDPLCAHVQVLIFVDVSHCAVRVLPGVGGRCARLSISTS